MLSMILKILKDLMQSIFSVVHLVYPELCMLCEENLPVKNAPFCVSCKIKTPYTDQFQVEQNELEERFLGRIKLEAAAALFHFQGGGNIENLIYQLKYKNRKDIGVMVGKEWAKQAKNSDRFKNLQGVIPIPLHKKKKADRGYNQCQLIALGVSEILEIPVIEDLLIKTKEISSQTNKGRVERLKNVLESFEITDTKKFENQHLLLVDDVITTGATVEAAANKLFNIDGLKLSLGFVGMKLLE